LIELIIQLSCAEALRVYISTAYPISQFDEKKDLTLKKGCGLSETLGPLFLEKRAQVF
jgi:hypothetical protein